MMKHIAALIFTLIATTAHAQDWSKPDLGSAKSVFMTEAHDLWNQCAKQDFTTGTNIPVGSLRYNRSLDLWQEFDGSTWATAPISANALGSGGITSAMILDGTIASIDIGDNVITTADIATGGVGSDEISDGAVNSAEIFNGSIVGVDIANGSIHGGDKIIDGTITGADIVGESIGGDKIQNGTINHNDIEDNTVGTAEISDSSLTAADLAANSVESGEIASGAVGADEIASGAVGADEIGSSAVGADEIADNSIGTADIVNGAVKGEDIWNDVTTANIQNGTLLTEDIADNQISDAKIAAQWQSATVDANTLFDCGGACGNGTSETGTYRWTRMGPVKYFYLNLTFEYTGTSDGLGLTLPVAAGNADFSFNCTIGGTNGETIIAISNGGSTTQAILIKTDSNYGTGAGRVLKCAGFYE